MTYCHHLLIAFFVGVGLIQGPTMEELMISDVFTLCCVAGGFSVNNGAFLSNCTAAISTSGSGFVIDGNSQAVNCTTFGTGSISSFAAAWHVTATGFSNISNCTASECIAEGFLIEGSNTTMTGCQVNNIISTQAAVRLAGAASGCLLDFSVSGAVIAGEGDFRPKNVLFCETSGSGNIIRWANTATTGGPVLDGTTLANQIITGGARTITTPTVTSGVAFQPSALKNANVYIQIAGAAAGTVTVTMGPTTGVEASIANAMPVPVGTGESISLRVPCFWKVVVTVANATIAQTSVLTE